MKKTDDQLGMNQSVSRRDFIASGSLASLGLLLPTGCVPINEEPQQIPFDPNYPPTRTGMRGSHSG